MIDQIQQMVQQLTEKEVGSNEKISNNLAGSVAQETGASVMEGLKSAVSGGNMGDLMNMFNGTDVNSLTSNPVVKNIIDSLTSKLGTNVGLDAGTSSNFAGSVIPQILSMVLGKAKSGDRSEEHTSELQSRPHLVCRLLLEKKKKTKKYRH